MSETFDAIVVGAGPAGNAAAYTLARAGLSVLQLERGEAPGSKNVQGAILYSDALEQLIPNFRDDAPLERHIVEQRMWILDDDSHLGTHFPARDFNRPPQDRYTIIRARFDRWFSKKVREAGALVICETTVTGLLRDGAGKVIGVATDRADGRVYADVVILADGVNSTVATKAGFRSALSTDQATLAVKETLFLPKSTIENRFKIHAGEGAVIEMSGRIAKGVMGTAFLYTNTDSVSMGIGVALSDLARQSTTPHEIIEQTKRHASIRPLLEGGQMREYAAHLIPEGSGRAVPHRHGDGWLLAGDSGMFLDRLHREGSRLAMTTGRIAAETVLAARKAGTPLNEAGLAPYAARLAQHFANGSLHDSATALPIGPTFFTDTDPPRKSGLRRELLDTFGNVLRLWRASR